MRTLIAFTVLAVSILFVYSNGCRQNPDCVNGLTTCAENHDLTCHLGACYCEVTTAANGHGCRTQDDCPSSRDCHSGRGKFLCVDNRCRGFYN